MQLPALNNTARLLLLLFLGVLPQSGISGISARPPASTPLQQALSRVSKMVGAREYASSIPAAQTLLVATRAQSRPDLEISARRLLGGAQLATHQYRDALQTLIPARTLAIHSNDFEDLWRIDNNVGWIYLEMERLETAAEFADQALAAQKSLHKYDARPVILRALIYARSADFPPAIRLFSDAINSATDSGDLDNAATAWNFLGIELFNAGRVEAARAAQTESFRLRKLHRLPDLEVSMRALGKVLAAQGDMKSAAVLIEESLASMGDSRSTSPAWVFYRDRGQLRTMQGDLPAALPDLRKALELARSQMVIPTDDDRVTFESRLAELYSLYIDVGNRLYLQTRDAKLKEDVFEASEESRAASLRAVVPQPNGWRTRLSVEHTVLLDRLESAERSALVHADADSAANVRMLRASLDTVESRAGAKQEFGNGSALLAARNALDADSAILAFHLGADRSWVWVVTANAFDVFPLGAEPELAAQARALRESIRKQGSAVPLADRLGMELFGSIPPSILEKRRWIIALDQELFDLPLPTLRLNHRYLVEDHALLLIPGVRFLEPSGKRTALTGSLIGIGDPIYNEADARWKPTDAFMPLALFSRKSPSAWQLARLMGSGNEVRSAIEIWQKGEALTGDKATKINVEKALAGHPSILHLATHVVAASRDGRDGMLVLGLNSRGEPDFLTMREILVHPAPVGLVVMSGCASGDAKARPSTGLMGLTRSWLGAGASEVLATQWPALDDSGPFFDVFYRELRKNSERGASEALRQAQVAMIKSNSFRNKPDYWGSYFLIGKM